MGPEALKLSLVLQGSQHSIVIINVLTLFFLVELQEDTPRMFVLIISHSSTKSHGCYQSPGA